MVVTVWKEAGFFMIFYLAALQQIPPDLKEAAAIEGASRFTFFRRVTWPLLAPVTLFILVNAVINAFRTVDHIFIMTGGGPDNATNLLLFHIYEIGFKFWDRGYATALTMVLLAILGLLALVQFLTSPAARCITNERAHPTPRRSRAGSRPALPGRSVSSGSRLSSTRSGPPSIRRLTRRISIFWRRSRSRTSNAPGMPRPSRAISSTRSSSW